MSSLSIPSLVDSVLEEQRKPRIVDGDRVADIIAERVKAIDGRFHVSRGQARSVPGGTISPLSVSLNGNFIATFDVVASIDPDEIDPAIGERDLTPPSQERIAAALEVGLEIYMKQVQLRRLGNESAHRIA
ncbi:MAG: hypothetical protein G01um101425_617 [Candidatus Peregrinibacteria bacterium Gr01-1014_25]|nr:MAG: hypothetical protein G01um101425_617 [Candidatus Peregrinibacteria bacterium Gr01-1014_25]